MTAEQRRHIAAAMKNRSRQWQVRLGIGAAIAAVFFPLTGIAYAVGWLSVYSLLQGLESAFRPGSRLAQALGEDRYALACLVLIFVNNVVFGLFGAHQLVSGSEICLVCGPLLLGGAILNAVMVSPASRHAMVAAVLPHVFYIGLVPIGALRHGLTLIEALQITLATVLMATAALAAWVRLARTVRALERAQSDAEEANRAKSDFLATMSHEIRTPLNGVLGMAQAMAADTLSERQRGRLDVVTQSGQALLTILSDILDLAKIEAGKLELDLAPFDLAGLVERSRETFHAIAAAKDLALETRLDPSVLGFWRGDSTRLRQILSNLISNAIKFTNEGRVMIAAEVTPDGLRFTVEDTGPGVSPDQLRRLFSRFGQADASTTRKYGGTGLGLAICADLTELMGGSICAEHVSPHGLRFVVSVPMDRTVEPGHAALTTVTTAGDLDARRIRVLAAEDHPVNRQVLAVLLGQAGIVPHMVENGLEAVDAWRAGSPDGDWDLILMDVQMPVMDGPAAAQAIRSEERRLGLPPVPIIALTANVMTHQIESYRLAGMETFVGKPIQVETLLAGIEAALSSASNDVERLDETG